MATTWMEKSLAFSLSRQQTAVLMTPVFSSISNIGVPMFSSITINQVFVDLVNIIKRLKELINEY